MLNYDLLKYDLQDLTPDQILEYLRKSRSDDPTLSVEEVLERHESILNEWMKKNIGDVVPENNIYREVVSGETIDERPEVNKLLKRIESPMIRAILIVEPQRLTRGDLEDIGRLMKLIKYTNTLVITPDRIYNLHFEEDWEAFERELKKGNDFLEYTKKILNRGKLKSVSEGNFIGSIPPYGYDKTFITVGKKKCPTLIENSEQADVVRMIFDMYVNQNMGRTNIAHKLDNLGIKPPKGKKWSPAALKDMLENEHYIGKVVWNWRKTMVIVEDSEIIKTRPKAKIGEYLIYEGRHEGIIPEDLFMAARAKQGKNHRAKASTKIRNPLSGLVFCQCGRAMSYRTYNDSEGNERTAPRLLCDDQVHCKTPSVIYTEVYDKIIEILEQCIEDFQVRISNDQGDSVKLHKNMIKQLEAKLKALNENEVKLWNEKALNRGTDDEMPDHIFKQLKEKCKKEQEEVQQALCKAYESMPEPVDYEDKMIRFKDALDAMKDPDAPVSLINNLLKVCIEKITYSRKKSIRLTRKNCKEYGIDPSELKPGSNWYSPPFELDVKLKM